MLWPLEQCSSLKPVDNGLEKITVRDLKGQKRPCPEIHKLCFSSLSDVLSWACFLRQCGVIRWSLPYERRRRMKIYVAAAAALPSASSRKPPTHEEKKRRWRCSWFELLARGAALSGRSNKAAPHTLGHLLPGGAPVHCTSFRIHSDCYLLLLCSPPCRVETTDCRRNKGVSSAGRQWDAQPCQTERGIAQLLNRRESAKKRWDPKFFLTRPASIMSTKG